MTRPSRPFRDLLMFLQVMVVFVFLSYGGIACVVVLIYGMEACNIVTGVLRATVWRAVWTFCRFAAGATLTACGGVALGNFYLVLEQIRKGTFCTEIHGRMLGRMARCGVIMASVLAAVMSFYIALERKDMAKAPYIFGVNGLLVAVYMPLAFLTAALAIQGVRLLLWTLPPDEGNRGVKMSVVFRNLPNNPKLIFALLQGCCVAWLVPVWLRAARRIRWFYWSVQEGRGTVATLEIVDMALWAVMLAFLFLMCGRLRRGQAAATKRNARALLFLAVGCGVHAVLGGAVVAYVMLFEWQAACIGMMLALTVLRKLMVDRYAKRIY